MIRFVKQNLISCSIVLAGILISIGIIWGLNILQEITSIFGSLSIVVAFATYMYTKRQDKTTKTIDQISFFRKEIIPQYNQIADSIKAKYPTYNFPRIILDMPTTAFLKEKYPKEVKEQANIWQTDQKRQDELIALLNTVEEFALRAIHFENIQHVALESIKVSFVQLIEQNAAIIVFERDAVLGSSIYSATLQLYDLWKNDVDRATPEERLKRLGY